ncbi:UbiA prenyltransferase family-domain-containing protein [Xylariomycetidae sp. FL0641]|nr:UbiA prenyltransferase family-domain-containing protein [Xylariomycetidae sp. FL0641]
MALTQLLDARTKSTTRRERDSVTLYAGGDRPRWVDYVPSTWRPYVQLTRLNFAGPVMLIYFPHLCGVLHTVILNPGSHPIDEILWACLLLLGGSFFYSNAAHAWDDIVDVPLDRLMERTKNRPIARGAITMRAALLFTVAQGLAAASFLLFLPSSTAPSTLGSILTAAYYPWAKRHTHFPQLVLGFCLAWGVMTGSAALGVQRPWGDSSRLSLVLACTLWTVVYDTIYAYIDVPDDLKLGVKSTAVLFRNHMKPFLWCTLAGMAISLHCCGRLGGMGHPYFGIAEGGSVLSVGFMIYKVDLSSSKSCYLWFSRGFWMPGIALAVGLMAECILH